MSSEPLMVNPRQLVRSVILFLVLSIFSAASIISTQAQSFTLTVSSQLSPAAIDPGGSAIATLSLEGTSGSVSFTAVPCTVTPATTDAPQCSVSPSSATPDALPSVTVTTTGATPAGQYAITVTGASGTETQAVVLSLSVEDVTQTYTLTVTPTTASPHPIAAGSAATTSVTVNPLASYTGSITLSCLSISPVVTPAPVCSFNPQTVNVTSNTAPPASTLTIATSGPTPTSMLRTRRIFFALWLAIPGLVVLGAGAAGVRKKKILVIVSLTLVVGSLLLLPACSSSTNTATNNNGITPSNSYTITITGVDQNGAAPSTTTATTVTLVVD